MTAGSETGSKTNPYACGDCDPRLFGRPDQCAVCPLPIPQNKPDSHWYTSHRADFRALPIADRHYNRQKIGSPQFVPPGRCMVLLTANADALWVTSWPFVQFVRHAWAGAWMNSCFRNEQYAHAKSSELIREAVAITRWFAATNPKWSCDPEPPLGMVTFIDPKHVRHKRDLGRCYRKAGFKHVGYTKGGLLALQLLLDDMPEPMECAANNEAAPEKSESGP